MLRNPPGRLSVGPVGPLLKPHRRRLLGGGVCMLVVCGLLAHPCWRLAGRSADSRRCGGGDFPTVLRVTCKAPGRCFCCRNLAQFGQDTPAWPARPCRSARPCAASFCSPACKAEFGALEKLSPAISPMRLTEDAERVGEVIYKTIQDMHPPSLPAAGGVFFATWSSWIGSCRWPPCCWPRWWRPC